MTTISLPSTYAEKKRSRTALEKSLLLWRFLLIVSSLVGAICGLVGTTLGLMSLLRLLGDDRLLDRLGTGMLVVAFPMLIMAAHSLDKAHEMDMAIRAGCSGQARRSPTSETSGGGPGDLR